MSASAFSNCPTCERKQDQEHAEWCDRKGQRFPNHKNNAPEYTRFDEVDLCEDCVMREAGIYEEPEHNTDGLYTTCPEWDGWLFSSIYEDDDPEGYYEPKSHFSKTPCDGCHSTLWGVRYPHTAVTV